MANTFNIVSIFSFILTGVFLIVSIILFFALKIPLVLNYLSGKNVKVSVKKAKQSNEDIKKQLYEYDRVKETNRDYKQEKLSNEDDFDGKTRILNENYRPKYEQKKTERLEEKTQVLTSNIVFEYIDDIMLIHTEEILYLYID